MSQNEKTENREFTPEQTAAQTRAAEEDVIAGMKEMDKPYAASESEQNQAFGGDLLKGLVEAAKFQNTEFKNIEIVRGGVTYFSFRIRPLTEREYEQCKKKATKYVRNKQLGIKMPEDTNGVLYRSLLIYTATDAEDRKKTWDNRQLWSALEDMGKEVLTATDAIDAVLMPGEKAAIVEQIDLISGFHNENLEEVVKN